jgi:hypothetical protein
MPAPSDILNTAHAQLDRAASLRHVRAALNGPVSALRSSLARPFLSGSRAAAEAAASALNAAPLQPEVAAALRPLPPAVPPRNAPALAAVAARAATTAASPSGPELLAAFSFASRPSVRAAAVRALLKELQTVAVAVHGLPESSFCAVLKNISRFVEDILRVADSLAYVLVSGLCMLAAKHTRGHVAPLLIRMLVRIVLTDNPNPDLASVRPTASHYSDSRGNVSRGDNDSVDNVDDDDDDASDGLAHFLASSLSPLLSAASPETTVIVARCCLVRALNRANPCVLVSLWDAGAQAAISIRAALHTIGVGETAFCCAVVAAHCAGAGRFADARDAIAIARQCCDAESAIDPAVVAAIQPVALAIGALASAGGCDEISHTAADLRRAMREAASTSPDSGAPVAALDALRECAAMSGCSRASVALSLLAALRQRWRLAPDRDGSLVSWFSSGLAELIATLPHISDEERQTSVSMQTFKRTSLGNDAELGDECDGEYGEGTRQADWPTVFLPQLIAMVCVAGLWHNMPVVRDAAASAFAAIPSATSTLFFLPAVLIALGQERNGLVAARIIRTGLAQAYMIRDRQSAKPLVAMLCNLITVGGADSPPIYETTLGALSAAASIAPAVAFPVFLAEVEGVHHSFDTARDTVKVAAMAATVELVAARPARGPNFVPLISKCIAPEAAHSSPLAASLAFRGMREMAVEDVLDAGKALKIVFKSYDSPLAVPPAARRMFLLLLGTASRSSASRRGRATTSKAIAMLRDAVVCLAPRGDQSDDGKALTWAEVAQAADSLAEFESDDVLRIEFEGDEQENEAERERQRLLVVEQDVMRFVSNLVLVAGHALNSGSRAGRSASTSIASVLRMISISEWAQRPRSKFDPERISKLRSASEALRRARGSENAGSGDNGDCGEDSDEVAHDEFMRSAENLPDGAIKALSVAAACAIDTSFQPRSARSLCAQLSSAVALRSLASSGALSPALPWHRVVTRLLVRADDCTPVPDMCQSAAVVVAFSISRDSFLVAEMHTRVFGDGSGSHMSRITSHLRLETICALARCLAVSQIATDADVLHDLVSRAETPHEAILECVAALPRVAKGAQEADTLPVPLSIRAVVDGVMMRALGSMHVTAETKNIVEELSALGTRLSPPAQAVLRLLEFKSEPGQGWTDVDTIRGCILGKMICMAPLLPVARALASTSCLPAGVWGVTLQRMVVDSVGRLEERDRRPILLALGDTLREVVWAERKAGMILIAAASGVQALMDLEERGGAVAAFAVASGAAVFDGGRDAGVCATIAQVVDRFCRPETGIDQSL